MIPAFRFFFFCRSGLPSFSAELKAFVWVWVLGIVVLTVIILRYKK